MTKRTIEEIGKKALELLQKEDISNIEEDLKLEVLFPFIEALGYDVADPTEVVTYPVYDLKGKDYFDYGLIEDIDEEKYKIIMIFANSDGWKFPIGVRIQLFDPTSSFPNPKASTETKEASIRTTIATIAFFSL
mgnify:CR=1 FL=1